MPARQGALFFTSKIKGNNIYMSKKITVFTRSTCAPCKALKTYFNSKSISFTEVDVDEDPAAYRQIVDLTGYAIVPTTLITNGDSQEVISGFNLAKINGAI